MLNGKPWAPSGVREDGVPETCPTMPTDPSRKGEGTTDGESGVVGRVRSEGKAKGDIIVEITLY